MIVQNIVSDIILNTLKRNAVLKVYLCQQWISSNNRTSRIRNEWENMLGHQVPVLPLFEQFWKELPELFEWLYRAVVKPTPSVMPAMGYAVDTSWQPPAMAQAWHISDLLRQYVLLQQNRLCVDLTYQGRRLIEPYSLRRTRDGNLLLYAVKHNTGEDRSYRVDRIQGARATKCLSHPDMHLS